MNAETELTALRAAVDRLINSPKKKGEHLKAYTALIVMSRQWNAPLNAHVKLTSAEAGASFGPEVTT